MRDLPTYRYRAQHAELIRLMDEIRESGQSIDNSEQLCRCRKQLIALMRTLTLLLSLQDTYLYPRLLQHQDTGLRETVNDCRLELYELKDVAKLWSEAWLTSGSIADDPDRFRTETAEFFSVIRSRISKEEAKLYPIVDRVGWSAVTGIS